MRNKKEFFAAAKKALAKSSLRSKTSRDDATKLAKAQTDRIMAVFNKTSIFAITEAVEKIRQLRSEIGSGDDSYERTLLELHEETGLNIVELGNLPCREFDRVLKAAIRKRDSRNWIPVATEHLKGDRSTWLKKSRNPEKNGLRRIAHGQYQVRRDKLQSLIKPANLELYRN